MTTATAEYSETEQHLVDGIIGQTAVEPRPYQRRVTAKSIDAMTGRFKAPSGGYEPEARSVLVESPTGSGKTVMGHLILRVFAECYDDVEFGWVAMRRNLLSQAESENRSKGINVPNIHYVSMFDKAPEALLKAKQAGRKIVLAVDEAQHDAANSMAHLHNILEPWKILGLSATPFRVDRVKLCFDKVVKDAGIHSLIQDGYLSQYDHYTIPNWNPETVAEHYLRDPERWGKSIFYFQDLTKCCECFSILRAAGVRVDLVTGDSDREDQLDRFRYNELDCLVNCMVLTEGFDEPSLRTAWVRDSGKGPTMQMAGRVFRKFPGLDRKQIVQSKGTRWPMMRTALPADQYIWQESEWRGLTVNPHLAKINQNARLAIASTPVELPKLLTQQKPTRRRLRF